METFGIWSTELDVALIWKISWINWKWIQHFILCYLKQSKFKKGSKELVYFTKRITHTFQKINYNPRCWRAQSDWKTKFNFLSWLRNLILGFKKEIWQHVHGNRQTRISEIKIIEFRHWGDSSSRSGKARDRFHKLKMTNRSWVEKKRGEKEKERQINMSKEDGDRD